MKKFSEYLDKQMENPEFKKEYEALEPEFAVIKAIIDARTEAGITQKDAEN